MNFRKRLVLFGSTFACLFFFIFTIALVKQKTQEYRETYDRPDGWTSEPRTNPVTGQVALEGYFGEFFDGDIWIYIVNPTGNHYPDQPYMDFQRLAKGSGQEWSPDGEYLSFTNDEQSLFVFDRRGNGLIVGQVLHVDGVRWQKDQPHTLLYAMKIAEESWGVYTYVPNQPNSVTRLGDAIGATLVFPTQHNGQIFVYMSDGQAQRILMLTPTQWQTVVPEMLLPGMKSFRGKLMLHSAHDSDMNYIGAFFIWNVCYDTGHECLVVGLADGTLAPFDWELDPDSRQLVNDLYHAEDAF